MIPPHSNAISVVISTHQRPDACERALRSALNQTEPPLEVLVCDNGSTDETEARMHGWERRDERVRYLRMPRNSGTPATTRNLGIEHARGDWIAFLDDDDEWLPAKLAKQRAMVAAEGADAIATNALRSNGGTYAPDAPPIWHPTRLDVLKANPIIMSSALVRRELLLAVGGFPTDVRSKGFEDYAAWLELAERGARFLVLGDALVRYEDGSADRLSTESARIQVGVTRLVWKHALRTPSPARIRTALRSSLAVGHVLGAGTWTWLGAQRRNRTRAPWSPADRGAGR
ncbi:MAG TPA: glycosyltransferase family 2 protein [Solirubrobacteraceae bacterium]|nr:glycosyltransferase family 2 protein [Solirubrobacteraceae bacterium]